MQDEDLLLDAAENSKFFDVRSFAWERLGENNKSIAEIVINTKKNKHVDEIYDKIVDEETLEWIAIEADDKRYRTSSVEKINDSDILYDLVFKSNDKSIRKACVLKDSFTDEEIKDCEKRKKDAPYAEPNLIFMMMGKKKFLKFLLAEFFYNIV